MKSKHYKEFKADLLKNSNTTMYDHLKKHFPQGEIKIGNTPITRPNDALAENQNDGRVNK